MPLLYIKKDERFFCTHTNGTGHQQPVQFCPWLCCYKFIGSAGLGHERRRESMAKFVRKSAGFVPRSRPVAADCAVSQL